MSLDGVENATYAAELRELIDQHRLATGSTVAKALLERWPEALGHFVQVMPTDYKRVLEEREKKRAAA